MYIVDMDTIKTDINWDTLMQFLPAGWEEAAKNLGALQRQRKFKNAGELLRILLIHLADGCSMREATVRAKYGGLTILSDVALLKRLRSSSDWFRWMAIQLLNRRGIDIKSPDIFSDYNIKSIDASVITEPGSTGTDWRLHYSISLFSLQCDQFIISRRDLGESFTNFKIDEGDLVIGDRAYGRLKGLTHVIKHKGHFLARLKNKSFTHYDLNGNVLNLLNELKTLCIGEVREMDIMAFPNKKSKIYMRLCAIRKSDEEAEKAIKKAMKEQKKKQRKINPETLELHRYICLITSLPAAITKYQIAELYRTRWQVEIAFKRLKSIMGMGHLPKTCVDSARAWLHGKIFVALLTQAIIDEGHFFSPWGYPIG